MSKENIPVSKSIPRKFDTPWMDKETLNAVKKKRTTWKRYKYCRSPQNKENYDRAKVISSNKVRQAKLLYERSVALKMKDDTKIFWKFVRSKTKVKDTIQCIINEQGEIHTDDTKKAELLNQFFHSVFTDEANADEIPVFPTRTDLRLDTIQFNEDTVKKHLLKVKETKSQGSDSLHPKFIKETVSSILKPIITLFNESMAQMKLPEV